MRQFISFKTKVLALVLTIAALAAGHGSAWAASTFSVTSSTSAGITTFTITRSENTTAETVHYRTVSLSALEGQHFNAVSGSLTFAADETSKTVSVTERTPSTDAYKYQTGTSRSYRFEVTDQGGFDLAHCDRSITTGTSVTSAAFNVKDVTVNSGEITVTDANYSQAYHAVPVATYFTNAAPQTYFVTAGASLSMTLTFQAKEVNDGYQHLQILVNQTSNHDEGSGDNNPGTMNYSSYMATFVHQGGSYNGNYASYSFPVTSAGDLCGTVANAWSSLSNTIGELRQQKFNTNRRASDGRLVVAASSDLSTFSTLGIRFDASGNNDDDWVAKNTVAHIQAADATAPTKLAVSANPGRHSRGNYVSVSVAFSEIVTVTGTPTLTSSWGSLTYLSGSGSNVLTFRGTIPEGASGNLNVTALSGTVKDLAGNSVSGTVSASGLCTLDDSYAWPITYDLGGGTATNPATYTWETAAFTLAEPTREGYTFTGWTGSNGSTPQTAVTVANHSHAPLIYTANWEVITYTITYDYSLDGVSASNPATYTVETPTFTLNNPTAPFGYSFAGWTGTGLDAPTQTVTIAQGSTGDRTYTATWNNFFGIDADHDGTTAERAYIITTPEGLNLLASLVNGGNGFSGTFFKLGADIAYSCTSQWDDTESTENNYTSIGNYNSYNRPFRGTFDGCGHTVSGIRIRASNDYKGLFGYIYGGTVRNVTLSDSRITGRQNVGGIVGKNSGGTVENCHATATVAIYSRILGGISPDCHGGIVGENDGADATATVVGCTSAATVSGTGEYYGGVVGYNRYATVSRCFALGAVVTGGSYSGPVVGFNNSTVTDCHYRRCTVGGNARNDLYAVVAGTGVTLAPSGDATATYPYGGLQLFGSAILCGDTLYAPQDASVSLSLTYTGSVPDGYTFAGYTVTKTADGSDITAYVLNGHTLTMPACDVTVTATLTKNELTLADNSSNDEAIAAAAASGKVYEVTLSGRTLYRDGSWNTLCLPFDVSTASGPLSGDGVQAMTLDTSSSNLTGSTLTLNFTAATTIPAGTPFIIKWDNTGVNIENPIFVGVTIDVTNRDATIPGVLTFTGTYAPVSIADGGDNTKLYLGSANKLYHPNAAMTIGTHRAYFQLSEGITAGEPTSPQQAGVRAFVMNFGDESTEIISVHDSGFMVNGFDEWYSLDGRKLDRKPTLRGIYINKGNKIIIK